MYVVLCVYSFIANYICILDMYEYMYITYNCPFHPKRRLKSNKQTKHIKKQQTMSASIGKPWRDISKHRDLAWCMRTLHIRRDTTKNSLGVQLPPWTPWCRVIIAMFLSILCFMSLVVSKSTWGSKTTNPGCLGWLVFLTWFLYDFPFLNHALGSPSFLIFGGSP